MSTLTKDHVEMAWLENGERPVTLDQVVHTMVLDANLRMGISNAQYAAAMRRRTCDITRGLSGGSFHYTPPRRIRLETPPPWDRGILTQALAALAALAAQGEIAITQVGDEIRYEPSAAERARYVVAQ